MAKKKTPQLPKLPVQSELFRSSDFINVDPHVQDVMAMAKRHIDSVSSMIRHNVLHPDTAFAAAKTVKNERLDIDGINVSISKRVLSFEHSLTCVCCGKRRGNLFVVERHENETAYHFNLYSVTENEMVLMTVDHILPDSLGGRYDPANFQTMCRPCNQAKQNTMSKAEVDLVRANPSLYCKSWVHLPYLHVHLDLQDMMRNATKENSKRLTATFDAWRKKQRHSTHEKEARQITAEFRAAIDRAWAGPLHKNAKIRPSWINRMLIGISRFHVELKPIVTRLRADLRKAHSRSFAR